MLKHKRIVGTVVMVVGVMLVIYPLINSILSASRNSSVINDYNAAVSDISDENKKDILSTANDHNRVISSGVSSSDEYTNYYDTLNLNGVIGYLSIPKININLPIYPGTSDDVLEQGVGHLSSSSLPIGGQSTHSVLVGHSGLSKVIFDNLTKLQIGDSFYITVLDKKLTYDINRIITVLPNETQYTEIERNKDYVTLLTCVPYGINSHRLLIRGERVYE